MDNGSYEQYQQEQKRRQRIKRKLEKRLLVVREEENSIQDFEALHSSLISLDKSDEEQDTGVTRPLVWRAEEVSTIFQGLHLGHKEILSNQQGRQCVNRRVGPPTSRSHHEVPEKLLWAMKL
ncbi:uncharacterized protein LOC122951888 [Acropora millepora]|uniref:uncharacterized protein LOC122951888 n=1 Tax=Acropora millepora TaxID=45264 RepID=UPI001CF4B0C2|nr:uncharacterized protein LOC122951888 [Acropora millepora]